MRLLLLLLAVVPAIAHAREEAPLGDPGRFPLRHTHVQAEVAGPLADVQVVQSFENRYDRPIEVVYTFPLPADAAVRAMEIHVGERIVRGSVKRRAEAQAIYEEARDRGALAARLDQERPNVFTQRIANVLPGESIEAHLRFTAQAAWGDGAYELALPLVVGPRFHPGRPLLRSVGEGTHADTDQVPDASLVSPPYVRAGTPVGRVGIRVHAEAGLPVGEITSPSHDLAIARTGVTAFEASVTDALPNQDFVLRWAIAAEQPEVSVLAHRARGAGAFLLQIHPPADAEAHAATGREVVLLLDASGSMHGHPLATARAVAAGVLQGLDPRDTFQIVDFASSASAMAERPLLASRANVERGLAHLEHLIAGGGTHMIRGIEAALGAPADPQRLRIVLLLTDGYIGNEAHILEGVNRLLGGARLFSLGVGTSVNRFLLDELAAVGRGAVDYVRPDEDAEVVVQRFRSRIERPVITDLELQAEGVDGLEPARLPDLFAGQPLLTWGRYERPGLTAFTLRGKQAGRPWSRTVRVHLPADEPRYATLGSAWARAKIGTITREQRLDPSVDHTEAIIALALEHQLATEHTSFVAVEERPRTSEKSAVVVQPALIPAGVDYDMSGAGAKRLVAGLLGAPPAGDGGLGLGGLGSRGGGRGAARNLQLGELHEGAKPREVGEFGRKEAKKGERKQDGNLRQEQRIARLTIDEPKLTSAPPGLATTSIHEVLEARRAELQQCSASPGEVRFELRIHPDGRGYVTKTLRSTLGPTATTCIRYRLAQLRFAAIQAEATAEIVLRFVP